MPPPTEFCTYIMELLGAAEPEIGTVRQRSMFGGYGIFADDLMFALIARDTLYIKVDDQNRPAFEAENMEAFAFSSKGKAGSLSYYEAPSDALESAGELAPWAALGIGAAKRAAAKKRPKKNRGK